MRDLFRILCHTLLAACLVCAPGIALADPASTEASSNSGTSNGGDSGGNSGPFTDLTVSTGDGALSTSDGIASTPMTIEGTTNAMGLTTTEALTQTAYGLAVAMALGLLTVLIVGGAIVLTITAVVPKQAVARLDAYVRANRFAILHDLSMGGGESMQDLASWFNVPVELRPNFGQALRHDRLAISWALGHDTGDFAMSIWMAMLRDAELATFLREQGVLSIRLHATHSPPPNNSILARWLNTAQ